MPHSPHIILVHGLGRSRFDMVLMKRRLGQLLPEANIHCFDYHSRKLTLREIAETLARFMERQGVKDEVSFVGHSLGGIVVRALDAFDLSPVRLHRLVTLGSPHGSATIARWLMPYSVPRALLGPVLTELSNLPLPLQPKNLEVGCVVGGRQNRFGYFPVFGEDNDGLVLVREAALSNCKAVAHTQLFHAFMPFSSRAATLCGQFLAHGDFATSDTPLFGNRCDQYPPTE